MKKLIFAIAILSIVFCYADNNFSSLLLEGKPGQFTNPRDGWVWFKSDTSGVFELGGKKFTIRNGEGFACLPKGTYDASKLADKKLVVRSTPELIYYRFAGYSGKDENDAFSLSTESANGSYNLFLYNWKYLRHRLLDNYTTIYPWGLKIPGVDEWIADGRKSLSENIITRYNSYESVLKGSHDGMMIDEFIIPVRKKGADGKVEFGWDRPGLGMDKKTLDLVRDLNNKYAPQGKPIYAWVGLPTACDAADVKPLADVLKATGGKLIFEAYCYSRNIGVDFDLVFNQRVDQFLKADPEVMKYMIVAPSTFAPSDKNAEVDFKAHLDRQFRLMATDKRYKEIAGISSWTALQCKPEHLDFFTALIRHYCIEGQTESLAEKLNFPLKPGILKNPEWTDGFDGWSVNEARPGSVALVPVADWLSQLGIVRGYYPKNFANVIMMTHDFDKANSISQPMKNLEKGRIYALSCQTGEAFPPVEHILRRNAVTFTLKNCEVISYFERPVFDHNRRIHHMCWNNHEILFRPTGDGTPELIVMDRGGTDTVQAKLLIVDGIRICPWFDGKAYFGK